MPCASIHSLLTDMRHLTSYTHFLLLTATLLACGGSHDEPSTADNTKDRKIMLTHWTDNIIVPAYENFQNVFALMIEKTNTFTTAPDATSLAALRTAWVDAYTGWQKVELFEFGPADKYTLRNFANIYPADVAGIIANMNDPSANLDLPAAYATQGFPALDYLINGVAADDAAIVAAYTTDADAQKRIDYLVRITTRMSTILDKVVSEWKGPYRDTFINKSGLDVGSSMGLVVNAYVRYYERYIRSGKIGIPSGAAIGSTAEPFPERVEAYYKRDISRQLAQTAHQAARDFFNGVATATGNEGPSFKSYLNALGAKDAATGTTLSDIINAQFETINAKLETLSPDLYEQIITNNAEMFDTYAAMQRLVRILKVDMTSAMSVTITYTDNDGD